MALIHLRKDLVAALIHGNFARFARVKVILSASSNADLFFAGNLDPLHD